MLTKAELQMITSVNVGLSSPEGQKQTSNFRYSDSSAKRCKV